MFAGRTLPGVSDSRKRERKHRKGNSLLAKKEREKTKKGDGE